MKKETVLSIVSYVFLFVFVLLMFLSFCIPVLASTSSSSTSTRLYLFDIFGASISSSGSATNGNLFYGFLFLSCGLVSSIFVCNKNKTLNIIGIGLLLGFLAESIYLCCQIGEGIKAIESSFSRNLSKAGFALLIITVVFGFIYLFYSLFVSYCLPILSNCLKPKKSLEDRLNEINQLKEKGLINETEASKMREDALK